MHRCIQNVLAFRILPIVLLCLGVLTLPIGTRAQGTVDGPYVSVSACNAPISSCTVYVGSTVPQGDAIMVVASWGGASTTATINDGRNSYSTIFGPTTVAGGTNRGQAWIVGNTASGVTQATVSLSAPSTTEEILIWIIPLKGLDPVSPIDANVTHVNSGTGTSMTTGTSGLFSSVPKEMIWGIFLEDNYSTPYAPGSGFTNLSGQEAASLIEYKNVTTTGTQTAVGTNGFGSNKWIGAVVGLRIAGQGSGSAPTLSSIAVTPANPSVVAGATQQFTATGTYSDGSSQNLTSSVAWTSTSTAVATINSSGLASAVSAGSTTIRATLTSIIGSTGMTVTAASGGGGGSGGTLPGLVGYWTFNEGSGTTAADSSGNNLTATLFNGVSWTTGVVGGAISANGSNQYVTIPAINLTSTSAASVAMWVNRTYTSGSGDVLLEFSNNFNSTNNAFGFFPEGAADCGVPATEIGLVGNNGYDIKCYKQPSSGAWHHLVVVYDYSQAAANSVTFYVDGILQTSLSQPYSSNNSAKFGNFPVYLFSRGGTSEFSAGQIGDLQIYNRALSASDVQTLFNSIAADYTLTALPSSQTVIQGNATTYTATVAPLNGFSGSVALSATGLPAGATASFNPTQVSSGSSTLTVTAGPATPAGSYTLTITGTSGSLTHSANVTLVVSAALDPDFSISAAPSSQTVAAGSGTSYTSTITASGGFSGAVSLSISGLPTGANGAFNPSSVSGSGSSTLNITTSANTPVGSYTLTITGISGSLTHSATSVLTVSGAPGFSLTASPSSRTVAQGSSTTYTPTVTALNGFSSAVSFSLSGLPNGATGTFNPTSVTGSGSSTLTVATAANTPTGTYTLTITGTSGSLTQSAPVTLVVGLAPSFSLTASPGTQTVVQGAATSFTPAVTALNGFSSSVSFSVSGLPTGVTGTFNPTSVTGSGSSTLTLSTSATAATGSYALTITGTSGSLSQTASVTLLIVTANSGGGSGSTLPGLVGYWTFDEGSGSSAADSSGNGRTATLFNGVSWTTGNIGGAISANGNNQYVAIPSINLTSTSQASVSMWVNRTYTNGPGDVLLEFSNNFNSTNNAFGFFPEGAADCGVPATEISLKGNNGYNIKCYPQPSSGVWHLLVAVYDVAQSPANSVTFYVDGVLQTALSQPYTATNSTTFGNYPVYLFSRGGNSEFGAGQISDLQIYNRALSASDVQTLFNSAAPGFVVSTSPISQRVIQGNATSYATNVTPSNGFSGSVSLSVSGLPAGAAASFSPSLLASGSSTLSITTDPATPAGSYLLTITGTSGSLTQSETVALIVNGVPGFSLTASPSSQTVIQGSGTSFSPTVTAVNGFASDVAFSVSGLPNGATGTFNPTSVTGSGSSTLTVTTAANTPTGSYTLTITGSSGSLVQTSTVTLVVNPPSSFTLAASPSSQTVTQGGSTTFTPSVTGLNGFSSAVSFSVTGLPSGATGTFNPTSVTGSGSSTLTVATAANTPAGSYTLTITGTSGSLVESSTVTLVVSAAAQGNFTLTSTPTSRTIVQGNSTTYSMTVAASNGFTGPVTFSVSGLPAGATASFSPATVTTSGSTTMTVATTTSSPVGSYPIVVTGTSGSLSNSVTVTLVLTGTFSISVSPSSQAITAGSAANYTVTENPGAGFTGTVSLTVSGLPRNATAVFTPASISGTESSVLKVTTTGSTFKRTYTLTITGTSGSITSKPTATLTVQ